MSQALTEKENKIKDHILAKKKVLVAYSGGVDSTLVAKLAHDVLGEKATAVIADSPSLSRYELQEALGLSKHHGFSLKVVHPQEMENPDYLANPNNRCYFCKEALYDVISKIQSDEIILDGSNADDEKDFRPGREASLKAGVISPLLEAGVTKDEVRHMAKALGLENWDKPATPCLASRLPHGTPVSLDRLHRVEQAENVLRKLGFTDFRVRDHMPIARLEILTEQMPKALKNRDEIQQAISKHGFRYVAMDLRGLQSGSLNPIIKKTSHAR